MIYREICDDYKKESRSIEIIKYLIKHIKDIFWIIKELSLSVTYLTAIVKCISFLQLPTDVISNNLFAVTSYIDVIKQNIDILFNRLDYDISGIMLERYIINFLILEALIGTLFYMNESR
jgi:hypothetical protein